MATRSALLAPVTITTTNQTFGWIDYLSAAHTVDIDVGTYTSMLHLLAELEDKLQVVDGQFTLQLGVDGQTMINHSGDGFEEDWANTDDDLEAMLGFDGTETQGGSPGYLLTSTDRVLYSLFPPCNASYPTDRREIRCREQETDDGDMVQYASSTVHRYRELTYGLLSPEQTIDGGEDDDGWGITVDWTNRTFYDFWEYIRDKSFRHYETAADWGDTVNSPGTEGTEFETWRRFAQPWEPHQVDPDSYAYFDVTMALKYVGGAS